MATKEDRTKRPVDDDKKTPDADDDNFDDDDDDDDDDMEKSVSVVDAKVLRAFIADAVGDAISKALPLALADPDTSLALAKAIAPELGVGRLRKALTDFTQTVNDRFDSLDETHETLSKALAAAPPATPVDDAAAKTTPAEKQLSKALDGDGAEPLPKQGEGDGANSEKAKRGQLLAKAQQTGRISDDLISKALNEAMYGGIQDDTFTLLKKACTDIGIC